MKTIFHQKMSESEKKGAKEKKEEKEENLKGKREKIIMCLFSEERSYIQEALLVVFFWDCKCRRTVN